jgi:hypothetical protein
MSDLGLPETRSNISFKRPPPPALNLESPALVQPFKEYVSKGLVTVKVTFSPMGCTVECIPQGAIRREGEGETTVLPYGVIRERIEESGLASNSKKRTGGRTQVQPQPLKSLCLEDFEDGNNERLKLRIRQVATALGPDVARSRIMTHKINSAGHDDFESWWSAADFSHRARLLVDERHAKKIGSENLKRLASLDYPCPFRGPLSNPQAETSKEKTEVPKAQSTNAMVNGNSNGRTTSNGGKAKANSPGKK